MYLTFEEYTEYGGTITDETAFNQLEFEASTYIDWFTFSRLKKDIERGATVPEAVKRCEFAIMQLIQAKMNALIPTLDPTTGVTVGAQITSYSNDGVSVDYNVLHADEIFRNSKAEIEEAIQRYLSDCRDSLGRKLLYRGIYPDE